VIFVAAAFAAPVETCAMKFDNLAKQSGISTEMLIPTEEEKKAAKLVAEEVKKLLGAGAQAIGKPKALAGDMFLAAYQTGERHLDLIYKKSGETVAYKLGKECKFVGGFKK
jgi:hypothetical protein